MGGTRPRYFCTHSRLPSECEAFYQHNALRGDTFWSYTQSPRLFASASPPLVYLPPFCSLSASKASHSSASTAKVSSSPHPPLNQKHFVMSACFADDCDVVMCSADTNLPFMPFLPESQLSIKSSCVLFRCHVSFTLRLGAMPRFAHRLACLSPAQPRLPHSRTTSHAHHKTPSQDTITPLT
jgi:hypothetical protein